MRVVMKGVHLKLSDRSRGLLGARDVGPVNGKAAGLSAADMETFRQFALALRFPPNPNRTLGDGLPTSLVVLERLPAALVNGEDGSPLRFTVPIHGQDVVARIWRVDVGRVPLYLLDSDLPENDPVDRWITSRLYVGDRDIRLAQYALLGSWDFLNILEAPDATTIAKVATTLAARGTLKTTTLQAIEIDELIVVPEPTFNTRESPSKVQRVR